MDKTKQYSIVFAVIFILLFFPDPVRSEDELFMVPAGGELHDSMLSGQLQTWTSMLQVLASQVRPSNPLEYTNGTVRGQSLKKRSTGGLAFWGAGFGSLGDVKSKRGISGFDLTNYGGMLSGEFYTCSGMHIGGTYSYSRSEYDLKRIYGESTSDGHFFGAYIKWKDDYGYGIFSGGYGISKFKTERGPSDSRLNAKYDGCEVPVYLERGLNYGDRYEMLQPYLALQYVYLEQEKFEESGGADALQFGKREHDSLRSILGVRIMKSQGSVHHPVQMYSNMYWVHEYLDQDGSLGTGPNGTGFETTGIRFGRDWFSLGFGTEYHQKNNWSMFINYEYQFNNRFKLHHANIGLRYAW